MKRVKVPIEVIREKTDKFFSITITNPDAVGDKRFENDLFFTLVLCPAAERWLDMHEGRTPSA